MVAQIIYIFIVSSNVISEGTTTNGDFLLPFKTGAFLARVPVLPVILRYPYQRFSLAWDSISGVSSIFLLFLQSVNNDFHFVLPTHFYDAITLSSLTASMCLLHILI